MRTEADWTEETKRLLQAEKDLSHRGHSSRAVPDSASPKVCCFREYCPDVNRWQRLERRRFVCCSGQFPS